jgi:hypothetical protein
MRARSHASATTDRYDGTYATTWKHRYDDGATAGTAGHALKRNGT